MPRPASPRALVALGAADTLAPLLALAAAAPIEARDARHARDAGPDAAAA